MHLVREWHHFYEPEPPQTPPDGHPTAQVSKGALREYTYVPQGSGIVYITITHRMHAEATKECPGRAKHVPNPEDWSVTGSCLLSIELIGTFKNIQ